MNELHKYLSQFDSDAELLIGYWKHEVGFNQKHYRTADQEITRVFAVSFLFSSFTSVYMWFMSWFLENEFADKPLALILLIGIPLAFFCVHDFYCRSIESNLIKSFESGVFSDIPADILNNELAFKDDLLDILKIDRKIVRFLQCPGDKYDNIFVTSYGGKFCVVFGAGFFPVLQEHPGVARAMVCHELAHIRNGDVSSFQKLKIQSRGALLFYVPPMLLLPVVSWWTMDFSAGTFGAVIITGVQLVLLFMVVVRLLFCRLLIRKAETNADILATMCIGAQPVFAALQNLQENSDRRFGFHPSIAHRLYQLEGIDSIVQNGLLIPNLSDHFECIDKVDLQNEVFRPAAWPNFFTLSTARFVDKQKVVLLFFLVLCAILSIAHMIVLYYSAPSPVQDDYSLILLMNLIELSAFLVGIYIVVRKRRARFMLIVLAMSIIAVIFHTTLVLDFLRVPNYSGSNLFWGLIISFSLICLFLAIINDVTRRLSKDSKKKEIFSYSTIVLSLLACSFTVLSFLTKPEHRPELVQTVTLSGTKYVTKIEATDCGGIQVYLMDLPGHGYIPVDSILLENSKSLLDRPTVLDDTAAKEQSLFTAKDGCFFQPLTGLTLGELASQEWWFDKYRETNYLLDDDIAISTGNDDMYWLVFQYGDKIAQLIVKGGYGAKVVKTISEPSALSTHRKFLVSADKKYLLSDGFEGDIKIYQLDSQNVDTGNNR